MEDPSVDGMIRMWIFRKLDVGHGLDRAEFGYGPVAGSCKGGDEHSGSLKCGECLD